MARRSLRPVLPAPPVRMCVGCRVRAAKPDLLRVVGCGNEIVPDPQARLPGRGAYLHPSQSCLEQAQRRKVFGRALRLDGPVTAGRLEQHLARCEQASPVPPGSASPGGEITA